MVFPLHFLQEWEPPGIPPEQFAFRSTVFAVTIVVYTIIVLGFGYWAYRKTRSTEDWMAGGRRQPGWLVGLSWMATYYSAVMIIGFGGKAATVGGLAWSWVAAWNALFGGFLSATLAYWVWRAGKNLGAQTIPDLLAKRYPGKAGKIQQVLLALFVWIFMIFYVVATNKAAGNILQVLAGWPYWVGVTLAAVVAFVYIAIGGLIADLYTDALQAVILMVGTIAMAATAVVLTGGLAEGYGALKEIASQIEGPLAVTSNQWPPIGHPLWWVSLSICIFTSFNIFWPHLPQRFLAYRSKKQVALGIIVASIAAAIPVFCVYVIAAPLAMPILIKESLTKWNAPDIQTAYSWFLGHPDLVIPKLIETMWPIWASAIYLAAIFCAIMSTTDGIMHLAGAVIGSDVVRGWVKPTISERGVFRVIWVATLIFGILGWLFALYPVAPVLENFAFAISVPSAALAGPLLGVFWKRITRYGALTGMIVGAGFTIIDNFYSCFATNWTPGKMLSFGYFIPPFEWIHPWVMGVVLSLVVTVIVSLVTPKEPKEHLEKVFAPV